MADPRLSAEDVAALREIIRTGSLSFYMASQLLPAAVRDGAFAIYAFCRMSDDLIDCDRSGPDGLAVLHQRLDAAYAGAPWESVIDRCFAATLRSAGIPRAYPEALLEGFAWDIEGRRHATLADVRAYAARVAGSVGAMMAVLMGARTPLAIARASDLGTAMQLTNIARDVGEDAREGRLYLPEDRLRDDGLSPGNWLADPVPHPAIDRAVALLLAEADRLYARGLSGLACLPLRCRPAILAAGSIYREIGSLIASNAVDPVTRRAVVPGARKLQLAAAALPGGLLPRSADPAPALPENQFLVGALPADPHRAGNRPRLGPAATMLDLLLTAEARKRGLAGFSAATGRESIASRSSGPQAAG